MLQVEISPKRQLHYESRLNNSDGVLDLIIKGSANRVMNKLHASVDFFQLKRIIIKVARSGN